MLRNGYEMVMKAKKGEEIDNPLTTLLPSKENNKRLSILSVGARVVRSGWVGLYGRPLPPEST
jgi:hypothetical protein